MKETIEGTATEVPSQQLTTVPVYTQTARDLAELESELKGLVINVDTKQGMKEAKAVVQRLVKCRTTLEAVRKTANEDLIKAKSNNDDEAKRIKSRIVALEEPIRLQVEKKEAEETAIQLAKEEASRLRVEKLTGAIQSIRDTPASVQGQSSVIINGALARVRSEIIVEAEFAEYYQQAIDARDAVADRLATMLHDQRAHEAEQAQIKADREELERQRAENERLQREADERAAADRAEAEKVAQAEREAAQAEQDRLAAIERGKAMAAAAEERDRLAAERAEQDSALQAERERQAAEQKKLDEQAAQLKREQQAAKAEAGRVRLASLGLNEAVRAVLAHFEPMMDDDSEPQCIKDLRVAFLRDATPSKPARAKSSSK